MGDPAASGVVRRLRPRALGRVDGILQSDPRVGWSIEGSGGGELMIANDQQRVMVSRQLQELEAWRDRVLHDSTQSPFQTRVEVAGIEKMLARLREEIEAYESAKAGQVPLVVTAQVQD